MRRSCLYLLLLQSQFSWAEPELPADPLRSPLWEHNIKRYLGPDASVVLDDRVGLTTPEFAEDSTQVPLTIQLAEFPHEAKRVVAWIDLNPIPLLFDLDSAAAGLKLVSLNYRVQQASSVRAAVQDESGTWHIDSAFIDAAGGGCTAPRVIESNSDWENQFGQIRTGLFPGADSTRVKVNLLHPMDSGMVGNVPAFYVRDVEVRTAADSETVLRMNLAESAAENPMFVFEFDNDDDVHPGDGDYSIAMRDNNGYRFDGVIKQAAE